MIKDVIVKKLVRHLDDRGFFTEILVLGNEPACIVYFTTESYDSKNPDEKRISWDDPVIGFDWGAKHR